MPEFPTASPVRADVTMAAGACDITCEERESAHVDVAPYDPGDRNGAEVAAATEVHFDGERLTVRGGLTMKGVTQALEATGTFAGPTQYIDGSERIAIALQTVVNRHDFGVSWNAPLPGGGNAVGDDVTLSVDLQLVK